MQAKVTYYLPQEVIVQLNPAQIENRKQLQQLQAANRAQPEYFLMSDAERYSSREHELEVEWLNSFDLPPGATHLLIENIPEALKGK